MLPWQIEGSFWRETIPFCESFCILQNNRSRLGIAWRMGH